MSLIFTAWGSAGLLHAPLVLEYSFYTPASDSWSPVSPIYPVVEPGTVTSFIPAMAVYNGLLYMAWKGGNGDNNIYYASFDGTAWSDIQQVPGAATSGGVSLATALMHGGNRHLLLTWKGEVDDTQIYYNHMDGSGWSPQQLVPDGHTNNGPSVANIGDDVVMVWADTDNNIMYNTYTFPDWSPPKPAANFKTGFIPVITGWRGKWLMAWVDAVGNQGINYSTCEFGLWTIPYPVPGAGSSAPLATTTDPDTGRVYLSWKGMNNDSRIFYSSYDGTWQHQNIVPGSETFGGPAMAAY